MNVPPGFRETGGRTERSLIPSRRADALATPGPERQEGYDDPHTQSTTHEPTGMNPPENPAGCRMTLGHPPWVAIEEAMHHAERIGYIVPGMNSARIPS